MEIKKEDLYKAFAKQFMLEMGHEPSEAEMEEAIKYIDAKGPEGIAKEYNSYGYHYNHPDYRENLKPIIPELEKLAPGIETATADDTYETICKKIESLSHEEKADAVNNLILHHLASWYNQDEGAWMWPVRVAVALMEHFKLHECLPVYLELLRQDYEFMKVFFRDDDLDFMLPGILYQIMEVEDLPVLMKFMKTKGMLFFCKRFVALAVANLPKKDADSLPKVQEWLAEIIQFYAPMGTRTNMFDESLLDTLVYGCIHTHAVNAKDMIIRLYNQYKLPNIMVEGGVNEVRKTIKKASIGTLNELDYDESGERVFVRYIESSDAYDDGWDDEEDMGEDEWGDEDSYDDDGGYEDFDLSEYDWQEYAPWARWGEAEYKPILSSSMKRYKIRVSLQGVKPEIWREFEVPYSLKLTSLSGMILYAMGWDEDHLHQFIKMSGNKRICYATSYNELSSPLLGGTKDGSKFCIGELVKKEGDTVLFEYDYGDGWMHIVTLGEVADFDGKFKVSLLDGKRACPPEDCGGVPGYMHVCQAMKHMNSSHTQEMIEWLGCKYDPERFPLDKAKKVIDSFNK